jgi:hypothetical protein
LKAAPRVWARKEATETVLREAEESVAGKGLGKDLDVQGLRQRHPPATDREIKYVRERERETGAPI